MDIAEALQSLIPTIKKQIETDAAYAKRVQEILDNPLVNKVDKATKILEEYLKRTPQTATIK